MIKKFKIDLIVWKLSKLKGKSDEIPEFKIDLIVWKLAWLNSDKANIT